MLGSSIIDYIVSKKIPFMFLILAILEFINIYYKIKSNRKG